MPRRYTRLTDELAAEISDRWFVDKWSKRKIIRVLKVSNRIVDKALDMTASIG